MSCPFTPAKGHNADSNSSGATCPIGGNEVGSANGSKKPNDHPAIDGPGQPIPHPPESWFVGNLRELDPAFTASSIWRLADIYGPIFSLNLPGRKLVVLSNFELINEVCDDERFEKYVTGGLESVRVFVKNGLFTAYNEEEEWGIAHRTLVPAFGPLHIRKMFPKMIDVVSQMILRWDRYGPGHEINIGEDFTRLAFDVIGLCAFNYRFNSFYSEDLPVFAKQMAETLLEAGKRTSRLPIENTLRVRSTRHMMDNIHAMWKVCDDLVAERRANPQPDLEDLLNVMLTAKDPVTGKSLPDENIRFQMATFLVAGHETSAGTMDFLIYNLLHHPEALQKCYREVDAVVGTEPVQLSHIPKLKYLEASMREALRYQGPIALLSRHCKKPTTLAGKYNITPDQSLVCNLNGLHHDPAVWGPDAGEFKPERFLDGGWERLPQNAWRPFGTGVRGCIGRTLAEQEIMIAMAMILQAFVIEQADSEYQLKIKATLTIKPDNYKIRVRRRPGRTINYGPDAYLALSSTPAPPVQLATAAPPASSSTKTSPLALFYGGNTGTCKAFAEDIQTGAASIGYAVPSGIKSLDEAVENLPTDRPVVIVASSYEGLPPDNARNFVAWLESRAASADNEGTLLNGVMYAVFGAGNHDWAATFHRIPKLIDNLMTKLGATRLLPAGFVDVSEDVVGPLEDWKAALFPALTKLGGSETVVEKAELKVEIIPPSTPRKLAGEEVSEGLVLVNKEIVPKGVGPRKMHMEVLLPPGQEYRSGDYLVVMPYNPRDSVIRVLNRFGLHADDLITISDTKKEFLTSGHTGPITVFELVATRIELATPASQRQVAFLASLAADAVDAAALSDLASDARYHPDVLSKRFSVLDLLEDFPSVTLPFAGYLDMLPPLSPRQYSISSSPLASPPVSSSNTLMHHPLSEELKPSLACSITYDVYSAPALSGRERVFKGVSSNHLSLLSPGSRLRCFVRRTNAPFRLPTDPKVPVIMVAAGTGIAPMRAFVQERAALASSRPGSAQEAVGPAVLYFGCRDFDEDFLYRDELAQWEREGVVRVRVACSRRAPEGQRVGHVDELIWGDREELRSMFKDGGARILVCGSAARLGRSTQEVCLKIYQEANPEKSRHEAETWLLKQKEDRYVSDVFG